MDFLPLFYQILVLFMILLIGFSIYRLRVMDDRMVSGLSRLVIDVTLPALIITSMNFDFSREKLWESGQLILISLFLYLFSWLVSYFLLRWTSLGEKATSVFQFMLIFPNVGFMGYPVVEAIYGKTGLFYTSIFNFTYGLLVWTLGVWIYKRNQGKDFSFHWKSIFTPGMMAVLIGFGIFVFSIKLPDPIFQTLDLLGSTTTPLSMLVIGALLGSSSLATIWKSLRVYFYTGVRLIIIPLLMLILSYLLGFRGTMLGVIVILAGMPAAANTAMFAERFGGDADLGAKSVFISTLFSLATIPGLVYVLQLVANK